MIHKKTISMTEGSPLKVMFLFFLPLVNGFLLSAIASAIDTSILGRYIGGSALAASTAASLPVSIISVILAGFSAGLRIRLSSCFGAGNKDDVLKYTSTGICLILFLSVVLCGGLAVFIRPVLSFMATPDDIYELSCFFGTISVLNLILSYFYDALLSLLRAGGRGNTLMVFTGINVGCKIVFDLLFVVVLNMGVLGVFVASAVTTALCGMICIVYVSKKSDLLDGKALRPVFDRKAALSITSVALPLGLQSAAMNIGALFLQYGINKHLGSDYITATSASSSLISWLMNPMVMWGMSFSIYCGQNLGAGKSERIGKGIKTSLTVCLLYSLVCVAVFFLFAGNVASLFTDKAEVIPTSVLYSRIVGCFYPPLAVVIILREYIQGTGHAMYSLGGGICEFTANTVAGLILIPVFGEIGAMCTNSVAWLLSLFYYVIVALYVYRRLRRDTKEKALT